MASELGEYFRVQCKMKLRTLSDVARMVGYQNTKKGVRRLLLFEKYGIIKPNLLVKVAEVLDMEWWLIEELAALDEQNRG